MKYVFLFCLRLFRVLIRARREDEVSLQMAAASLVNDNTEEVWSIGWHPIS